MLQDSPKMLYRMVFGSIDFKESWHLSPQSILVVPRESKLP